MLQRNLNQRFYQLYDQLNSYKYDLDNPNLDPYFKLCKKFITELKRQIKGFGNVGKGSETDKERKLLQSELECWILVKQIIKFKEIKSKRETWLHNDTKKLFYKNLQVICASEKNYDIIKRKVSNIAAVHSYIPTSQYYLVKDIIAYDDSLLLLSHLILWLNKIYKFNEETPIISSNINKAYTKTNGFGNVMTTSPLSTFNSSANKKTENPKLFDPDHIFCDSIGIDNQIRYEHGRLMHLIFDYIRAGKMHKASDVLISCNQMWRCNTLNGGLPFHDFLISDNILIRDYFQTNNEKFVKYTIDEIKNTHLLDIMKTKEWHGLMNKRANDYASALARNSSLVMNNNDLCRDTMGNINWILWFNTCKQMCHGFNKTKDKSDDLDTNEMLVYAALSYNYDILREHIERDKNNSNFWHDSLWLKFRTYQFHETMRKYLILSKIFHEDMPLTETSEQEFMDSENGKPEIILKKLIGINEYTEDDVKNIFIEMNPKNTEDTYINIQFKLCECLVLSILDNNKDIWQSLMNQLYQIAKSYTQAQNENPLIGHKLRFCAFLCWILQEIKYIELNDSTEKNDGIWDSYLRHLTETNEHDHNTHLIHLYLNIKKDEKKIKLIGEYLSRVENQELRMKYKDEIDECMPKIRQDIFREIVNINERMARQQTLESENKRIESLKWLYLDKDQFNDALHCSLQLTRSFLIDDNIDGAMKLHNDLIKSLFSKADINKMDSSTDKKFQTLSNEKDTYNRLFNAQIAYDKYYKIMNNLQSFDMSSSSMNLPQTSDTLMNIESTKNSLFGDSNLKIQLDEAIKDCIIKIKKAIFGESESINTALFDFDVISPKDEYGDTKRYNNIVIVSRLWIPKLLRWLMEIFENNPSFNRWNEILILLGRPNYKITNFLTKLELEEIIKRLISLMIKSKKIIIEFLKSNPKQFKPS